MAVADPEVVVRLLAAIDEVEQCATAAGHGFGHLGLGRLLNLNAGWTQLDLSDNVRPTYDQRFVRMFGPDRVLRLCQSHRDIVAMFPVSAPHVDTHGSFYGFQARDCGEHRTVGPHRAWCFDCSEWCHPNAPCRRCHGVSEVLVVLARGYGIEEETTDGSD